MLIAAGQDQMTKNSVVVQVVKRRRQLRLFLIKKFAMEIDIICFSHLRWKFVYQRPQHLMSRAALSSRIFYFEEAGQARLVAG